MRVPVVEGLDAEAVAGGEQALLAPVPDREGEHPAQPAHAVRTPAGVGGQHGLGVGLAAPGDAGAGELGAQLAKVVDLAVQHDDVAAVGRDHRLVAARGQVEHGEPPVGQGHPPLGPQARIVRTPPAQALGRGDDRARIG